MHSVRKPWWQQATALVTVTTGGVITGFNFVPGAAATMTSPTSVPLHLLALEQAAQPGAAMNARAVGGDTADSGTGDALLRSAIVNVAKYYLQIAATRSPAQMEALIWDNTSLNGADHGPSCAAFASLTLELAAQAVGQQSWVSGGKSYPYPLPVWADVRVDPNPASPGVTSVMADAKTHGRWHPVGGDYQPQPGDWVLFEHHVEVVTRYSGGVLDTIGADSDPGLTVNAHSYGRALAADGVVGFVDNGHLDGGLVQQRDGGTGDGGAAPQAADAQGGAGDRGAQGGGVRHGGAVTKRGGAQGGGAQGGRTGAVGDAIASGCVHRRAGGGSRHHRAGRGEQRRRAGARRHGPSQRHGSQRHGRTAPRITARRGTAPRRRAARRALPPFPASSSPLAPALPPARPSRQAARRSMTGETRPRSRAARRLRGHAGGWRLGRGRGRSRGEPGLGPLRPRSRPRPRLSSRRQRQPATPHASPAAAASGQYKQYAPAAQATPGTRTQQAFISLIAPGAVAAQQRWGVPAAVTIAQAIEESSWGNSQLAADYHNLFGIKGSGPAGSVGLPTSEFYNGQWVTIDAQFRVYHNVAESIADHAELLATSGYYQRAMADRAIPDAFANDLTGVYATDPDYGANLIAIMKLYNLYRFDGPDLGGADPARVASRVTGNHPVTACRRRSRRSRSHQPRTRRPSTRVPAAPPRTDTRPPGTRPPGTRPPGRRPAGRRPAGRRPAGRRPFPGSGRLPSRRPASLPAPGPGQRRRTSPPRRYRAWSRRPRARAARRRRLREQRLREQRLREQRQPRARAARLGPGRGRHPRARRSRRGQLPAAALRRRPPPPGTSPQFTTAVTTAYFATAKGPLGHGEHLYRDVAAQTGIRWELLAACDWMQCKAHPRYSPVHGEKIGALNSDGTSYATKSAALGQCARDLIELASAVYGIDLTARRLLSVRALADAFAAFRWGALLVRHGVSAMEFPYSVAGLTAQHQKMHWPVIDDPAAPDRPGARFREPFGAVPVVLSLDYPATVLTDRKRRQPRVPVPFLAPTPVQPWRPDRAPRSAGDRAACGRAARARAGGRAAFGRRGRRRSVPSDDRDGGTARRPRTAVPEATVAPVHPALG